jgi:Protein of unknown function (DUF1236)
MRAFVLSVALFIGLGSLSYGQNQPQTLKGVYAPPGMSALGQSSKSSTLSGSDLGAVGNGPRVLVPGGDPVRGQVLPNDVTPRPIPDRPGYGAATVNGRRVIVDLNTNRVYQVLN